MANTAQARKRVRQAQKARAHNRAYRSKMRTFIKGVRESVKKGDKDAAQAGMVTVQKEIDKTCSKGLIAKNTAARLKSRLVKLVKTLN